MPNQSKSNLEVIKVMPSIDENLLLIKNILGESIGLKEWKFKILGENIETGIVYIESICDNELIRQYVVDPLQNKPLKLDFSESNIADVMQVFYLSSVNIRKSNMIKELIDELLKGDTLLFFNNTKEALVVKSRKIEKRSIDG